MGIFRNFPYTNFHELNLDWIIKQMKNLTIEWGEFVVNWGKEVKAEVDEWLTEHPEATTTVLDNSLSYKKLITGTLGFVTPEMFGAVGDGTVDDAQSLQDCIDYAFTNKLRVYLGAHTYAVSRPITIHGGIDNTEFGNYIEGDARGKTTIRAITPLVSLVNLGDSDASTVSSVTIKYLHIDGNNIAYQGLALTKSTANINISDVKISNCVQYGFYSSNDLYLSTFTRIRVDNCTVCGIYMTLDGINTSCNFINCYVQTSENGYVINGIYMNMDNCCADSITDTVLDLSHYNGTVTSFGSESYTAKCMFKGGQGTNAVIVGPFTWGNFTDSDAVHIRATSSAKMIFVGGRVLYDWRDQGRTAPGKLYYTASIATLYFLDVYHDKSTGDVPTDAVYFDTGGWRKLPQHQGTNEYDLPSEYNELKFEITDANIRITIPVLRNQLVSNNFLHFDNGYGSSSGGAHARVDATLTKYKLADFTLNGTDITSTSYIQCYYK